MYDILIVDDEPGIRTMLQDFLETNYNVESCPNAQEALEKVKKKQYNLVISDINMPGMKGYELLKEVEAISPLSKTALITAYNVDDYIRLAKKHGICNIISKTTPFNFDEVEILVKGLTSGDVFGIDKQLQEGYEVLGDFTIKHSSESVKIRTQILEFLPISPNEIHEVKLVLDEIMTNAIYHSAVNQSGEKKYTEYKPIQLEPSEHVNISIGRDDEKVCISIMDNKGSLDKDKVLYLIDRHVNAEGILDESGRGIFMSRLFADRIAINIDPGKRTEFVISFFLDKTKFKGYKPLYINQL